MAFALPGWWELTMTKLRRKSDGKKNPPPPQKMYSFKPYQQIQDTKKNVFHTCWTVPEY